jgi:hypothetical protein
MIGRRSPAAAVVGCAVGGLLVLLASGRQWAHARVPGVAAAGSQSLSVTGHVTAPSLPALGIALLALAAAILASKRLLRRVVGLAIVVLSGAVVGVAVNARGDVSSALAAREVGAQGIVVHASANAWWLVAAIGGVIALLAGALTVIRAREWAALGAKYDAPSARPRQQDPSVVTWDALDRGEDPTA